MSVIYINISEDSQKKALGNEFQYIKAEIHTYVHSVLKNNTNKLLQNEKKIDWTDTFWSCCFSLVNSIYDMMLLKTCQKPV